MTHTAPANFAMDSLENLRRRLLDLTARNRLLNFTHGRQGNVRLVDELPSELHRMLLSEQELRFRAVPDPTREQLIEAGYIEVDPETEADVRLKKDPTATEWAREIGRETSYDLPAPTPDSDNHARHVDKVIQTMMFPSEMESRLRGLRNRAETAIEETGANICYAAFGFLEWMDNKDSDKARYAPLLLVPVRIEKGRLDRETGTYHYSVAYTGEDILPNLSLREKLRIDFNLALPDLDESTTPDDYFEQIERLIRDPQPLWRVRRWASVALFNFSKLLMYLDLDPARWPDEQPIIGHPIVSRFFAASENVRDGSGLGDEYSIDDLPDVHERYPIIDDADSSQHSALVDVIDGKNLVIEGPPGTGKSQTITNLIAAALAQGKRVLFVAEKLAALEVVKRRLDRAGLGDFCLELHSHKTQKRKVLDDIRTRLNNQSSYRHPEQIDADIARYETLKDELRAYAELINRDWKQTGRSIHEILMAATRYRTALGVDPTRVHPDGYDGEIFTGDTRRQSLDTVRVFADVYRRIAAQLDQGGDLKGHPWYGVRNRELQLFDTDRVCALLQGWQDALARLARSVDTAGSVLGVTDAAALQALDQIETLMREFVGIPELQGREILSALPHLRGDNLGVLTAHLQVFDEIRLCRQELSERLRPDCLGSPELQQQLRSASEELMQLGPDMAIGLGQLSRRAQEIGRLRDDVTALSQPMSEVALRLGSAYTDVVKMDEAGLIAFRDLIELVGQLRPGLLKLRGEYFDDDALDDLLPELKARLETLEASRELLAQWFSLDRLPLPAALEKVRGQLAQAGLFRWFSSEWRAGRRALRQLASNQGARFKDLSGQVDTLCRYASDKQLLEDDGRYKSALGAHFTGIDTRAGDLMELRGWYRAVRLRFGIGFGPTAALGDQLLSMSANLAKGIQSLGQQGVGDRVDAVLGGLGELKSMFRHYQPIQQTNAPLVTPDGALSTLQEIITRNLAVAQQQLVDTDAPLATMDEAVTGLERLEGLLKAWKSGGASHWFGDAIDLLADPERLDEGAVAAVKQTEAFVRALDERVSTDLVRDAIDRNPSASLFDALCRLGGQMAEDWKVQSEQRRGFSERTELDLDAWGRRASGRLDGLRARNQAALDRPDWLSNWLDYVRVRHQCDIIGFAGLTGTIEEEGIGIDDIDAGYRLGIYDLLARQILKEIPALARFSGNTQLALQTQFRTYDEKLKLLQRERIASLIARNPVPRGSSGGRVSNYTERVLLEHEAGKKTRHVPLRQLLLRAGNALAALKPCFMMGPMSAAQYLAPGQVAFDLVVMDEASQMKPEDALGAIARGGQLVVVGDPKQLPPTSFFDKMVTDDDEDATAIEESESILDTAAPMFDTRRLRWHYRSQHEDLIAFSNHAFYGGDLVVFPAPYSESEEFGVKFTRIPHGRFVNRRNAEEARVIAEAVRRQVLHRPGESLGVVAMSADQRDQIERAVEDLAKEDPLFQDALDKNQRIEEEPLFVKNLENVQGDERDVIYISCTYGPNEVGGKVFQRFGPINSDVGWRRLNVLFTRSKKRMHVFSSMGSEDIVVSERSKKGVAALKDFLAFAETGHLHREAAAGKAPDSDFEVAVSSALAKAGFECVPQVGVAGFFIDIAVRDPGNPGRYLMGIECDGASYHSAKSVRDRDRLRQTVLERLGWHIRRIWSTDWYRNPQAEIQPIIRELEALRTERPVLAAEVSETAEIAEIVGLAEAGEASIDAAVPERLGLRERLSAFDADVIRAALPEIPANERLLRPAMLEALLEFLPITKSEFVELIPLYLRQAANPQEGEYLEQVLRIIEESEVADVV